MLTLKLPLMVASVAFLFLLAPFARCQTLPHYDIQHTSGPIVIDGKADEAAWKLAKPVGTFHFNTWKEGEKELTDVAMLWDEQYLYVAYYCHDKHISASVTQRHGPVSKDDCVEIFVSPDANKVTNYYTFEINAIGTMLNRCRTDWWTGAKTWDPEGVVYRTTFQGLERKDELPEDDHWSVELAIPFKNFVHDASHTPPRDGDEWRINLMRIGGITNAQASTWSPLAPGEGFHTPTAFGWVRFVSH
jgi:hypothetical protein